MFRSTAINENEIESDSELEIGGIKIYDEKTKRSLLIKKVIYCGIILMILLISMVIATLLWPINNNKEENINNEKAFYTLQDLMENHNDEYYNENDHKLFETAFKIFDIDNDGYLNEIEFIGYFKMELDYSNAFESIDIDKDNIISYPEAVVYVRQMIAIPTVKQYLLDTILDGIKMQYGFEYVNESSLDIFSEYVAILMYFETFDIDMNGYIHHDEYTNVSAHIEFNEYDLDSNGKISNDAFFDILYGNDDKSWKGKLHEMYGDNYQQTMNDIASIYISANIVKHANINLSPIQLLRKPISNQGNKRRLACQWVNTLVYDSNCNCWTYKMEYRCTF